MKFKPSTLKERDLFYRKEFSPQKALAWFKIKPQYFAIDAGTESNIIKNPKDKNWIINLKPNINSKELKQKLIHYLPEDLYYDRNTYKDIKVCERSLKQGKKPDTTRKNILGQELAFDLDSENLSCNKCSSSKSVLKICKPCLSALNLITLEFYKKLRQLKFKNIKIVYTGRGYHVHVFDKKAYSLTIPQRRALNQKLKDFPLDPWVSEGYIRLMRVPYSLNALVSRIVTPLTLINLKKFNPELQTLPKFLKN